MCDVNEREWEVYSILFPNKTVILVRRPKNEKKIGFFNAFMHGRGQFNDHGSHGGLLAV
jgi:hypothetical protein